MLRDGGAVGRQPSRCVALIVRHYGLAFTLAAVDGVGMSLKGTSVANHQTHVATHTHRVVLVLACYLCALYVLIMIWFVCNYKHSKMLISKSFKEFRPMGIAACF